MDFAIVSCEGRREVLFLEPDLVEIEHSHLLVGGPPRSPRKRGLRAGQTLFGAIDRVLPGNVPEIAFLNGTPREPFAALEALLRERGFDVREDPIDLRAGPVPTSVDVLRGRAVARPDRTC